MSTNSQHGKEEKSRDRTNRYQRRQQNLPHKKRCAQELEMLIHDTTGGAPEETPVKSLEVETEAVALDPEKCPTTTSDVTRLEMYLRNAFANVLSQSQDLYSLPIWSSTKDLEVPVEFSIVRGSSDTAALMFFVRETESHQITAWESWHFTFYLHLSLSLFSKCAVLLGEGQRKEHKLQQPNVCGSSYNGRDGCSRGRSAWNRTK